MTYRDEDDAADARIQRLEEELASHASSAGDPEITAALHHEADELNVRRKELEAERKAQSTGAVRAGPPRRVWLGMGLTTACALVALFLPSSSGWLLLSPLPFSVVGAGLVIQGFVLRWREGAAAREAADRE